MRVSRRLFSLAKPPLETLRLTLDFEIKELVKHSKLFNQTSPRALLELRDVRPMMTLFSKISELGGGDLVASETVRALCFSARDSTYALRRMPFSERAPNQETLFQNLRQAGLEVCNAIENDKTSPDQSVINGLYSLFEKVDPSAGVALFKKLGTLREQAVPGSELATRLSLLTHEHLVPCIVKAAVPLEELERLAPLIGTSDAGKAYLAWGYLKYGNVAKAKEIFDDLIVHLDRLTSKLSAYLLDAFVGDAPPPLAIDVFTTFKSHVPHPMSVSRMLRHTIEAADLAGINSTLPLPLKTDLKNCEAKQLVTSLYFEYISRLAVPNDMDVKSATLEFITCLLADGDIAYLQELLPTLIKTYESKFETTELLMNVILSRVSKLVTVGSVSDRRYRNNNHDSIASPKIQDFIRGILNVFFGQPNPTPIGCRVQLSALRNLPLQDAEVFAESVWQIRQGLPQPIETLDLVALGNAVGKTQFFYDQLKSLDRDDSFQVKIRNRK